MATSLTTPANKNRIELKSIRIPRHFVQLPVVIQESNHLVIRMHLCSWRLLNFLIWTMTTEVCEGGFGEAYLT